MSQREQSDKLGEDFDPIEFYAHQYERVAEDSEVAQKNGASYVMWHAGMLARAYLKLKYAQSSTSRASAALAWAVETFGESAADKDERAMRFIEEAIELVNAIGLEKRFINAILFRVYDNDMDKGDRALELGQAALTLELLAEVLARSVGGAAAAEFARIQAIPKDEWTRRHQSKVDMGIAK